MCKCRSSARFRGAGATDGCPCPAFWRPTCRCIHCDIDEAGCQEPACHDRRQMAGAAASQRLLARRLLWMIADRVADPDCGGLMSTEARTNASLLLAARAAIGKSILSHLLTVVLFLMT